MKLAKTIIIMVLAVLLALSVSLNIFILTIFGVKDVASFKQVLLCKELLDSFSNTEVETQEAEDTVPEDTVPEDTGVPDQDTEIPTASFTYANDWIKVIQLKQTAGLMGPGIKFELENISTESVLISFREIYIDGYKADLSGLYCECLDPGMKAIEEFTLWESDWEDFTSKPREVQFIIEVCDPKSLGTLEYSSAFTITLD